MRRFFLTLAFACFSIFALKGSNTDSISIHKRQWYHSIISKTVFVPGLCIGYGLSVQRSNGWPFSSYQVKDYLQLHAHGFHTHIDDYLPYLPALAVYGLNIANVNGNHNFIDRSLLYASSLCMGEIVVYSLKTVTHIERPDHSAYNSFPSGHTMAAFVAAEFMHQEFKDKSALYSVLAYSVALSTAALRMLNNKHWLSDVAVGAGTGILCTRLVYLAYPWCRKKVLHSKTMF